MECSQQLNQDLESQSQIFEQKCQFQNQNFILQSNVSTKNSFEEKIDDLIHFQNASTSQFIFEVDSRTYCDLNSASLTKNHFEETSSKQSLTQKTCFQNDPKNQSNDQIDLKQLLTLLQNSETSKSRDSRQHIKKLRKAQANHLTLKTSKNNQYIKKQSNNRKIRKNHSLSNYLSNHCSLIYCAPNYYPPNYHLPIYYPNYHSEQYVQLKGMSNQNFCSNLSHKKFPLYSQMPDNYYGSKKWISTEKEQESSEEFASSNFLYEDVKISIKLCSFLSLSKKILLVPFNQIQHNTSIIKSITQRLKYNIKDVINLQASKTKQKYLYDGYIFGVKAKGLQSNYKGIYFLKSPEPNFKYYIIEVLRQSIKKVFQKMIMQMEQNIVIPCFEWGCLNQQQICQILISSIFRQIYQMKIRCQSLFVKQVVISINNCEIFEVYRKFLGIYVQQLQQLR